jgi:hypothetical protein
LGPRFPWKSTYLGEKSKEYTSSGSSGIHFGHFKAGCEDLEISMFDKWFLELSMATGYSLERWHRGIDVMIPKKKGSLRAPH